MVLLKTFWEIFSEIGVFHPRSGHAKNIAIVLFFVIYFVSLLHSSVDM